MFDTIVVLCKSHKDASDFFRKFINYIDNLYPWNTSVAIEQFANIVDTYENNRYIFCDECMENIYRGYGISNDFVCVDEFMEGIYDEG